MLCKKVADSDFNFSSYGHFKNKQISCTIAHGFFQKSPPIFYHIHIDVLMLCSKFEPILKTNSGIINIFKNASKPLMLFIFAKIDVSNEVWLN